MRIVTNTKQLPATFRPGKRQARFVNTVITPTVAAYLLDKFNTQNRPMTNSTVESYARDMVSGRWRYNGEAIKFSKEGVLINGQHRLRACVVANIDFSTDVLVGMSTSAVLAEDTGKPRSVSDVISIFTGVRETVSASRLRSVRNVIKKRRTRMSVSDFQDLRREFLIGLRVVNKAVTARTGMGRAPVAAGLILAAQVSPVTIQKMIANVVEGKATTFAQGLLHNYIYVSPSYTTDTEDERTQKVLNACYLEVTESTGGTKRLKADTTGLQFFVERIAGELCRSYVELRTAEALDTAIQKFTDNGEPGFLATATRV